MVVGDHVGVAVLEPIEVEGGGVPGELGARLDGLVLGGESERVLALEPLDLAGQLVDVDGRVRLERGRDEVRATVVDGVHVLLGCDVRRKVRAKCMWL